MVRVLMVCMGNICRSPMAEGALRRALKQVGLDEQVLVDSAGTHSYHIGAAPDERSQRAAMRRGIDLSALRARKVVAEDLEFFDYILAMDRHNYRHLLELCTEPVHKSKIRLLLEFAEGSLEREVPDPYYGGEAGFDRVMDLIEEASEGLVSNLRDRYGL